jgi:hypothetical protein
MAGSYTRYSYAVRFVLEQGGDLTRHQVLLVRPELYLPGAIAFGQRADLQRLQAGPGALRGEEGLACVAKCLLVGAEGPGAVGQLAVGLGPAAVGRQQHTVGQGAADTLLRVGGGAGAEGQAQQGESQGRTDHG